ncbi:MAG: alpha-L-fucosidase [Candidatus Symbiothrix sp.]|nr:alpha-L-fucosidase [Candidatus Symbiothrix sp.]
MLIFLFTLLAGQLTAQPVGKDRISLKHGAHGDKRTDAFMQHWREYGLGQFIHWGVYAIPGGHWNGKTYTGAAEWIRSWSEMPNAEYDKLYKQFNPVNFNAGQWAKQAKQMGAKYMIFTTKHHDGFCMWPSKYTQYTIANTPYKKDIVKELVDAYTAEGIDVYLYFSIIDWHHPGYYSGGNINGSPEIKKALREDPVNYNPFETEEQRQKYETFKLFTRNQLLELLDNYPSIKGFWFDGSWDAAWCKNAAWVDSLGVELRAKHEGLIIGSRFRSDEYGNRHTDANGILIDDYDQRFERNLPVDMAETRGNDWDCVMTIPENQWGYHSDWSLTYVKTADDLIEMAVKANSLNGNFVINFGPDGKGNIRKEETDIARKVGEWMAVNGAAIYGTQHSLLEKQDWGYATQKGDTIYLSVFNKPVNNLLRVKLPKSKNRDFVYVIEKAEFLSPKEPAHIHGNGKAGTYYRDKTGASYYDIILPKAIWNVTQGFVIVIKLKEIDKKDQEAYQQALT